MFYSHLYLRKNGRFGLVWLAATQSRILSRRELSAVNVSMTVSNILALIPSRSVKNVKRPQCFSLYLSSQLMYGSVRVLQKQWEFLLGDLTTLLRKFHPEITSTTEIDLIIARSDPMTLESCVPASIKDKCYDPFFGVFKENMADVQALLAIWDSDYVRREPQVFDKSPEPFKAELGGPHSVQNSQEIQIVDHAHTPVSSEVPGEQDLPCLDQDSLALFHGADQEFNISAEDLVTPAVSRILANQDLSQQLGDEIPQLTTQARHVEETPAVKTQRELPGTPQKPKRKHREEREGGHKKRRNLDAEEKESPDTAMNGTGQHLARDAGNLPAQQIFQEQLLQIGSSPKSPQRSPTVQQLPSPELQLPLPEVTKGPQNWLSLNTSLQLGEIPATPSPVRKRQPHKLIIDETKQMTRLELKKNMTSSSDTCITMVLPSAQKKDLFKEPGSEAISHSALCKLWRRNCRFGLRVLESNRDISDISPLGTPRVKRKENFADYETPAKMQRGESLPGPASIERGRDLSISSVNESKERSKSLIGHASDDSVANISADRPHISNHSELERSALELSLAPLPEEKEPGQIASPGPLQYPVEIPPLYVTDQSRSISLNLMGNMESELFRLVREKAGVIGNWTTFKAICPHTSSRQLAASLFQELCSQVGKRALHVRQDTPYGEIFIREPEVSMETS